MSNFLIVVLLHLIPLLLLMIPFLLLFDVSVKHRKETASATIPKNEPNMRELEEKLKKLLQNNHLSVKTNELQQELSKTPSQTIAAYIDLNKKDLKGFHLFQLILSLIKNRTEDAKIIRIMHHYLPSSAASHLHAVLHSFKIFLNVCRRDGKEKELLRDLNRNRVRTTLLYLENKLNQTLNTVPTVPPAMQRIYINRAVVYGLVFAAFSEFYDNNATEKILRLANMLSPEIFRYWHTFPAELKERRPPRNRVNTQKKQVMPRRI